MCIRDSPYIEYRDSLSDQNTDKEKYSLILANPPFKGRRDYDIVRSDLLKVCKTKKTELLFLALFIRMLKIGGRCACIVPDGVLFGSSTAHKAIRKALVEENRLEAVISMPSGVFKPYAGVSTAILIFTKTGHGGTDKVWFYDMKADGFSLDDKRTETDVYKRQLLYRKTKRWFETNASYRISGWNYNYGAISDDDTVCRRMYAERNSCKLLFKRW